MPKSEAAKRRVQLLVMKRELGEWERENGAFTEEEMAEAREWLDAVIARQKEAQREAHEAGQKAKGHAKKRPQTSKGRRSA